MYIDVHSSFRVFNFGVHPVVNFPINLCCMNMFYPSLEKYYSLCFIPDGAYVVYNWTLLFSLGNL